MDRGSRRHLTLSGFSAKVHIKAAQGPNCQELGVGLEKRRYRNLAAGYGLVMGSHGNREIRQNRRNSRSIIKNDAAVRARHP